MNKLLIICGPTATGKTNLGVYLAKKFTGEIVSADSRQVYQGMDIITGKDLPVNSEFIPIQSGQNAKLNIKDEKFSIGYREKDGIPIWLVDIVEPNYIFNVGEYVKLARIVVDDIWSRGKLPIVVGGTGLYIKALTVPLSLVIIPPNKLLRDELSKFDRAKLAERLAEINPEKWSEMNESDRLNPRRLIRAIEISYALKKQSLTNNTYLNQYSRDALFIGLTTPSKKLLYKLIDQRIEERVKKGAIGEVWQIFQKGYSLDLPSLSSSGYRSLLQYFQKGISLDGAIQKWKYVEHEYARKQLTWFKRDGRIHWFDVYKKDYLEKIEVLVRKWYTDLYADKN